VVEKITHKGDTGAQPPVGAPGPTAGTEGGHHA